MSKSGITYLKHSPLPGYTGEAWNPIIGCTHSGFSGCDHCWARELHTMRHEAWKRGERMPAQYRHPFEIVRCMTGRFDEPYSWRKPRLVMVCPQSDLFHDAVQEMAIRTLLNIIAGCGQHRFFVLTKRLARAAAILNTYDPRALPNLGVLASVSDQASADALIPDLLRVQGIGWRGVSYEPAVGPVDFNRLSKLQPLGEGEVESFSSCLSGVRQFAVPFTAQVREAPAPKLDLVIAGCESGRDRRRAEIGWFRSVRNQCIGAGVPFYLKQMDNGLSVFERPYLDGKVWEQWAAV